MKLRESYEKCRKCGPEMMAELKKALEDSNISHRSNTHTTEIIADTTEDEVKKLLTKSSQNEPDISFRLFLKEQRQKTYIRLRYQ